jgi:hypothetical protein
VLARYFTPMALPVKQIDSETPFDAEPRSARQRVRQSARKPACKPAPAGTLGVFGFVLGEL